MNGADEGDGRWLTYGQLAEARQIGRRAAIRLAQRHRLRRQPGNDGQTRIWVPTDMASSSPHRPFPPTTDATSDHDDSPPPTPFHAKALAALEDAVAALREQLAAAEARAQVTDTDRRTAEARADRAEASIVGERQRADVLRDRIEAMQHDLAAANADLAAARTLSDEIEAAMQARIAAAQDALTALRKAETDRKARGLVARLRAAWRGE
jgi:hypothetical protein